ncbi:hypothetical protein [Dyella sp.]|uniref:hypothetical protein n=1 Tax=Dyella sp. TaxID=1869338 RepID=UPI00283FA393|nr:hypothetical protein [Dyella sp.]MDR3445950.1 hypothetical protein [Dyella sp.]
MNAQLNVTPRQRLIEVAEWLEAKTPAKAGVVEFDMSHWVEQNECGTSCCIAGAIVQFDQAANGRAALSVGEIGEIDEGLADHYYSIGDYAGDLCGLNTAQADELFTNNLDATPSDAATAIRRFLDTGEMYWDGDDGESQLVAQSRKLPSKNSVLLGADGKPLVEGDVNVIAVLNTATGVVRAWKPFGNKRFRHELAINAASSLPQLPGHTSWELAPKVDLEAIIASSEDDVYDAEQYPDMLDNWYWSKDLYASSPSDYAWGVHFLSGGVDYRGRGLHSRALAVCRPAPASQQ